MSVRCATGAARLAPTQLYIGGCWRDTATVFGVQDPATGWSLGLRVHPRALPCSAAR